MKEFHDGVAKILEQGACEVRVTVTFDLCAGRRTLESSLYKTNMYFTKQDWEPLFHPKCLLLGKRTLGFHNVFHKINSI